MAKKKKMTKKTPPKKAAKKAVKKSVKSPVKKIAKTLPKKTVKAKAPTVPVKNKVATRKINWSQFLTPLDDRLVIEVQAGEKMTAGGLYIPDTAALTGNYKGFVLAVGRGHKNKKGRVRPMDVKTGDQVLFEEHAGTTMTVEGSDVRILRESEILGIVESK